METIKAYTDLSQSKKLAEILPLKSADMRFCFSHTLGGRVIGHYPMIGREPSMGTIPCWSLASLLGLIPQEIFNGEYIINITEGINNKWILTYDHCENRNYSYYSFSIDADNLVDACVNMIEKLHKLNLL